MKDFLTFEVESYIGAVSMLLLSGFLFGFLYVAIRNFDSELEIIGASAAGIRSISVTQRELMDVWVEANDIRIPNGKGYRWLLKTYPSKPWLSRE